MDAGQASINDEHYPERSTEPFERDRGPPRRPRRPSWPWAREPSSLPVEAAASGTRRLEKKMAEAVTLAGLHGAVGVTGRSVWRPWRDAFRRRPRVDHRARLGRDRRRTMPLAEHSLATGTPGGRASAPPRRWSIPSRPPSPTDAGAIEIVELLCMIIDLCERYPGYIGDMLREFLGQGTGYGTEGLRMDAARIADELALAMGFADASMEARGEPLGEHRGGRGHRRRSGGTVSPAPSQVCA